jgi:hypothetical protein
MTQIAPNVFPTLRGQQYMNLVTYRKSGEAVSTPVWFAEANGRIYLFTNGETGKVKRIRNNPQVEVCAADARGKAHGALEHGHATIVSGAEASAADAALTRKYGLIKRLFSLVARLRGQTAVYIAVSPLFHMPVMRDA